MKKYQYDVILCTYNGATYIQNQLESILVQHILPQNIIISDDYSQDNILTIAEDVFNHHCFKHYRIVKGLQQGAKHNFLSALKYAKSDYIFLADQDDIWHDDKVSAFTPFLEETETPLLLFSDSRLIDEKRNLISESFFEYQGLTEKVFVDDSILFKNCVQGATICINRAMKELILKSLNHVNWNNIYMHDWWIALLAKYYGEFIFINKPLIDYRQHASNQVGAFDKNKKWKIYLQNFSKFYHNFKLAILQSNEMAKLHDNITSRLVHKNKRKYHYIPKIKWLLIKIFSL